MFCFTRQSTAFHGVFGHLSMVMTLLLLLSLHLTLAAPLQPAHRREADVWAADRTLTRAGGPDLSLPGPDRSLPGPDVVPFINTEAAPERTGLKTRAKRAPQRGCQLGTCQLHNLADTLYQMGKTNGKDTSQRAHDPQGYGR